MPKSEHFKGLGGFELYFFRKIVKENGPKEKKGQFTN